MDNAVQSNYMLDKKLFINQMKSTIEDEQIKQSLKQQLANNSLQSVKKALLLNETLDDTYQEYKKDP